MATPSFSALAYNDLACPVCFELLKDPQTPKELDCSHVCCVLCIQKIIEGGRTTIDCPECRHVTRVPKDGLTSMRTNLRLRSLAETHTEYMTLKDAQSVAISTDDQQKANHNTRDMKALCPEHHIVIDFYCKKCNVTGCSTCMMNNHQGTEHDSHNIATVHRKQKEQLTTIYQHMDAEIHEYTASIRVLSNLQKSMENNLEDQHKTIKKQHDIATQNARQLKKQINTEEQPNIIKVNKEKCRLGRQIQTIKEIKLSAQTTIDTCPSDEYVEQHAAIVSSITCELGKDCKEPTNLEPVIGKARFRFSSNIHIGNMAQVRQCKLVEKEELGIVWCDSNCSIAVTAHGFLAVCIEKNNIIRIYRRQLDGKHKKETSFSLSKKVTKHCPRCVAVSKDGQFLVARSDCLEVYSLTGLYEGTFDFKPGASGNGKNICTSIRPIWVLVENSTGLLVANGANSSIVHFTHDGVFVDAIPVPVPPLRVTLMANGLIAVSNWRKNKVFIIDMESKREISNLNIDNANAICYHEESDTLLVGRCLGRNKDGFLDGKGVIEQYCPTSGKLVARLVQYEAKISYPTAMILTHDYKLIVANRYGVKVYDISC